MARLLPRACGWLYLAWLVSACGAATRAMVHEEDMGKVFPWPDNTQRVTIRVMPKTTMANTCLLFGSYEKVEVTPDTTFYITDELEKKFAYTPSRSPIRRLAPVKSMEILWSEKKATKAEGEGEGQDEAAGEIGTPKAVEDKLGQEKGSVRKGEEKASR